MQPTEYFILLYDVTEDYLERRQPLRPEHLGLATTASLSQTLTYGRAS